jgi:hypothetical protein
MREDHTAILSPNLVSDASSIPRYAQMKHI